MSQQEPNLQYQNLIDQLKSSGLKVTSARKDLVSALILFKRPFTVEEVLEEVLTSGSSVHRATIYRDLHSFVENGLLTELTFEGATAHYYEVSNETHHHHFICQNCFKIIDIMPTRVEAALATYENQLHEQGLTVSHHRLKFYGMCKQCHKSKCKA